MARPHTNYLSKKRRLSRYDSQSMTDTSIARQRGARHVPFWVRRRETTGFWSLYRPSIEFLVGPPTFVLNSGFGRENPVHGLLKRGNAIPSVDFEEEFAHEWLLRFDKTKKPVGVLLVTATADPQSKVLVHDREAPTPVFRLWFPDTGPRALWAALHNLAMPESHCFFLTT